MEKTAEELRKEELLSEISEKETELQSKEVEINAKVAELESKKSEVSDYETRKSALDSELNRVQTDIAAKKEERRKVEVKDQSFADKMRTENLEAAKARIVSEFKLEPDAQAKLAEEFRKHDSGSVNSDLLYRDFRKAYAAMNAEALLETQQRVARLSEGSAEFKAALSTSGFPGANAGPIGGGADGLTNEDIQAAQWAGMPLERYKQLKAEGKV